MGSPRVYQCTDLLSLEDSLNAPLTVAELTSQGRALQLATQCQDHWLMSAQELRSLQQEQKLQRCGSKLRSGREVASDSGTMEKTIIQLQRELEQAQAELKIREQELEEARGEVTRLNSEL